MKGNPSVVPVLVSLLVDERSAIQQYRAHESVLRVRGYNAFADILKDRYEDEEKHAAKLLERIFFCEASPDMARLSRVDVGASAQSIIDFDRASEERALVAYSDGITIAEEQGDYATRDLLQSILDEEREHLQEIEALARQLVEMTEANFLSTMTGR